MNESLGGAFFVRDPKPCSAARHQANKRNVSPQEAKILRGREYNAAKKSEEERAKLGGRPSGKTSGHNVPKIKVGKRSSTKIAEKHGVNEKTIRRDAVRAELHDAVQKADPKAAEKIASMPDKDVAEISKATKEASPEEKPVAARPGKLLDAEVGVLDIVRGTGHQQTGDNFLGVTGGEEHPTGDDTLDNGLPPDQPVIITLFVRRIR